MDISGPPTPRAAFPERVGPAAPAAAGSDAAPSDAAPSDAALRRAADSLEANFLSLMLKSAGLGEVPGLGGGGEGEEQFASFLRDEQARMMVRAGGIGLAEQLFEALKKGQGRA